MSYTPTESWLIDWCNKYATPIMQQCDAPERAPVVLAFMLPALAAAVDQRTDACEASHAADAVRELAELKRNLPAEMEGQRIVLNRCGRGHRWLVGADWVDYSGHGCPHCKIAELEAELAASTEQLAARAPPQGVF